jgi:aromatic ring-cleaving dioxygenase
MTKFKAHVYIEATDAATAAADLRAMSLAHTNKSVLVDWIETRQP